MLSGSPDLQRADEGLYTCVAASQHGKATWTAKLRLESLRNSDIAFFRSPTLAALPGPPSRPLVVAVHRSSVTLSWSRHSQIGSSSLLGYQVGVPQISSRSNIAVVPNNDKHVFTVEFEFDKYFEDPNP